MSLQYAKESIVINALKDIEENQKHLQEINLHSSVVWKGKSVLMMNKLADAMLRNTKLTSINLSDCMVNDEGLRFLTAALAKNGTLFHLCLSQNKIGRPALLDLGAALATNTGLISLDLTGIRVDSSVCACFAETFNTNLTLLKLIWDPEVRAYNLKFTELLNRNCEIDRAVHDGRPFDKLVPLGLTPPDLKPRVVPDPDEDEYALEVGEDNSKVWCQIAGRWELGEVQGRRGVGHRRKLVVTVEEAEHEIDPKSVTQFEPSHAQDLPNMVLMGNLHEAPLLYLLQRRLKAGRIYTWAGDVLISLNPYASVADLYQVSTFLDEAATGRKGGPGRSSLGATESGPHVYAIAKRAFASFAQTQALSSDEKLAAAGEGLHVNQSVLISGESGAGKTEAAKRVLELLTATSRRRKQMREAGGAAADAQQQKLASQTLAASFATPSAFGGGKGGGQVPAVEVLLREASPVLEAFGNAKTIRNDNSSRFGKYVAVQYDADSIIVGATSETYLLERSRVVEIASGERNYHIFYQLLTDGGIRGQWGLGAAEELVYLSSEPPLVEVEEEERDEKSGKLTGGIKYTLVREEGPRRVATVAGNSDEQEFAAVQHGLELFGMGAAEMDAVWRIVAAVALLGNVVFTPKEGVDRDVAVVADEHTIELAAAAFGCGVDALRLPMVRKRVTVAGDAMDVDFSCKAAALARDALARVIYGTLFDQLVAHINDVSRAPDGSDFGTIGILDIFGFENLQTNSFEQLCINYVNEMLQEQFNETVFAAERRLLKAEGIAVDDSALQSSATRLSLMVRILSTLDEQCMLGERANDEEFLQIVDRTVSERRIVKLEQAGTFSISHYAGKVFYAVEHFVLCVSQGLTKAPPCALPA
jgi:myosin-5